MFHRQTKVIVCAAGLLLSCTERPCPNTPHPRSSVADRLFPECANKGDCVEDDAGSGTSQPTDEEPADAGAKAPNPAASAQSTPQSATSISCANDRTTRVLRRLPVPRIRIWLPRIIGGTESDMQPWMVAFTRQGAHYCGGSAIGRRWVLTAAHCNVRRGDVAIIGVAKRSAAGKEHEYPVAEIIDHKDYDATTNENDIALVRLDRELTEGAFLELNERATIPDKTPVRALGWGVTKENGNVSDELRQVDINVVSNADCQKSYAAGTSGDAPQISEGMLCAGKPEGQKDSCQGDSGGPLIIVGANGRPSTLAGIVSFGIGCGQTGMYGVYTRVSKYLTWIRRCGQ